MQNQSMSNVIDKKLLICGCAQNAYKITNGTRIPCCVVHGTTDYMQSFPDLTRRLAKCGYGCTNSIMPSRVDLPYFRYKPDSFYDEYICGCEKNWD